MANLKHSPEGLIEAFEHQLVYEVNMLRHARNFLRVPAWSTELANAVIESFCVHARNLIEFFDQSLLRRVRREVITSAQSIFARDIPPGRRADLALTSVPG